MSTDIPTLLNKLCEVISRLRYVVSGDLVIPDDHNRIVDALVIAANIVNKMQDEVEDLKLKLASILAQFMGIKVEIKHTKVTILEYNFEREFKETIKVEITTS